MYLIYTDFLGLRKVDTQIRMTYEILYRLAMVVNRCS